MYKIGLTGGIGSGKTTVANIFAKLGVPVYNADIEAKNLMNTNLELKAAINKLFDGKAYVNGVLHRKYIASIVFANAKKLKELEQVVHPAVRKDFCQWVQKQHGLYVVVENAILLKSGMHKLVDFVIVVTSSDKNKINRVQKRDNLTKNEIKNRMDNQNNDDLLLKISDFVIKNNDSIEVLSKKVKEFDIYLKKKLKKS